MANVVAFLKQAGLSSSMSEPPGKRCSRWIAKMRMGLCGRRYQDLAGDFKKLVVLNLNNFGI
jgi:hypothetical protein